MPLAVSCLGVPSHFQTPAPYQDHSHSQTPSPFLVPAPCRTHAPHMPLSSCPLSLTDSCPFPGSFILPDPFTPKSLTRAVLLPLTGSCILPLSLVSLRPLVSALCHTNASNMSLSNCTLPGSFTLSGPSQAPVEFSPLTLLPLPQHMPLFPSLAPLPY